jgi:hypothetical protein
LRHRYHKLNLVRLSHDDMCCQVVLTRDHTKWNFEVLTDLIEGPLLNPKRLEEAFKATKFGRRLMSFFHPFSHRFSDIKKTRVRITGFTSDITFSDVKMPAKYAIRTPWVYFVDHVN